MDEATETYETIRRLERDALKEIDEDATTTTTTTTTTEEEGGGEARLRKRREPGGLGRAKEKVEKIRELVETLREIAEEVSGEERGKVMDMVRERELGLESTRTIMRQAALEAASASRKREEAEREALLTGADGKGSRLDAVKASGAVSISSEATESLRRARQMMATELEKGEKTLAVLTESTATMERTGTEYANQTVKLSSGRRLITTIERQTFLDGIILWTGFSLFLLVVVHILWKRTPVLARFHPLYYNWTKTKTLDVTVEVDKIELGVKESVLSAAGADTHQEPATEAPVEALGGEEDPYAIPAQQTRDEL
jgi:protein transport protein SEC20